MSVNESNRAVFTPQELATELGVDVKAIRAWLRRVEMRPEFEKNSPWQLTSEEAEYVRREFS
jgi:predicted site-specific integrase-resolvase